MKIASSLLALAALLTPSARAADAASEAVKEVAALDLAYQAAVARNNAEAMSAILADDFILVTGKGQTFTKEDLLREARNKSIVYERQDDTEQTVRVWGDTAVVTALLWLKGIRGDQPIQRKLWFSDTYVRTEKGWRYVLGQASLPLPDEPWMPSRRHLMP